MSHRAKALLIDDDQRLSALVSEYLQQHDFDIQVAPDGERGLAALERGGFDVVLLDLMLPGIDGLEVCRRIRGRPDQAHLPVVMLTAKGDDVDKIVGLELGADDYLAKPFRFAELVARIHALARRTAPSRPPVLHHGDLELDPARRRLTRAGSELELARKEFAVLEALMAADGATVSAEQLLERVWDEHTDPFTNVVRMTIMTLRRKLGEPAVVETVIGVGYRMG
jgi:DNA-binding response OmpR family regulator